MHGLRPRGASGRGDDLRPSFIQTLEAGHLNWGSGCAFGEVLH